MKTARSRRGSRYRIRNGPGCSTQRSWGSNRAKRDPEVYFTAAVRGSSRSSSRWQKPGNPGCEFDGKRSRGLRPSWSRRRRQVPPSAQRPPASRPPARAARTYAPPAPPARRPGAPASLRPPHPRCLVSPATRARCRDSRLPASASLCARPPARS